MEKEERRLPTFRNRTKDFLDYRKQKRFRGSSRAPGYSKVGEKDLEEGKSPMLPVGLPPHWVAQVENIQQTIDKIKEKMELLKQTHQHLLLPQFEESIGEEQRVEILTQEITQLFQEARKKVKLLEGEKGQKKLEKNLRSTLAQQLQDLSVTFRKYQKDFLHKLQQRQQKKNEFNLDISEELDGDEHFRVEMSFSQAQKRLLSNTEESVAQREREIQQIAKSIKELAQIFNDLATLVYEQGTIIDRIDYNLEVVEQNVEVAVQNLQEARTSQKKYTNKLCILLICLVILMGVIVGIKALFFPR